MEIIQAELGKIGYIVKGPKDKVEVIQKVAKEWDEFMDKCPDTLSDRLLEQLHSDMEDVLNTQIQNLGLEIVE